jgi:hypothetical protein
MGFECQLAAEPRVGEQQGTRKLHGDQVLSGGLQISVTKQNLDGPQVGARFQ